MSETCNVILDAEASEKKLSIVVADDSPCESEVIMCVLYDESLEYDESWSYC